MTPSRMLPPLAAVVVRGAGCGSSAPTLDRGQLQDRVSVLLRQQGGTATEEVGCPDDLVGTVGEEMRCTLTAGTDRLGLTVEVSSVEGTQVHVDVTVDDARDLTWVAGVPELTATAERQYGRVVELGAQKVWAFDEHGRFGVRADHRFDSEEGRDLVTGIAQQLGLTLRRGAAEKAGIIMVLIGAVGAVITVVVLAIVALAGGFSH